MMLEHQGLASRLEHLPSEKKVPKGVSQAPFEPLSALLMKLDHDSIVGPVFLLAISYLHTLEHCHAQRLVAHILDPCFPQLSVDITRHSFDRPDKQLEWPLLCGLGFRKHSMAPRFEHNTLKILRGGSGTIQRSYFERLWNHLPFWLGPSLGAKVGFRAVPPHTNQHLAAFISSSGSASIKS